MAKFIKLTAKSGGDTFHLNMDLVEFISSYNGETQLFVFKNDCNPYRVVETPEEIMKMLED